MRIVFLVAAPIGRGVYWRAFHLARHLLKYGHKVRLICLSKGVRSPKIISYSSNNEIILLPTSDSFGSWVTHQTVNSLRNVSYALSFDPDVIHVFGMVNPSAALAAVCLAFLAKAKRREMKLFLDWDDLWFDGSQGILRDYNVFIRTVGRTLEQRTLFFGDALTVVSEYLETKARRLMVKEIHRVPNGCDIDELSSIGRIQARKELGLPLGKPILVHVGFTDLAHAFEIVSHKHPQAMLIIVGEPPRFISLRIPNSHHNPGIVYTGPIPRNEVRTYLAAADVLVLKQENEATEMARWPIRFGDYLVAGRPIVTGRLGEVGRIMSSGKCGLTAEPGDQADLARCIIHLLENGEAREQFGKNAALVAKELAWTSIAKTLSNIYAGLSN